MTPFTTSPEPMSRNPQINFYAHGDDWLFIAELILNQFGEMVPVPDSPDETDSADASLRSLRELDARWMLAGKYWVRQEERRDVVWEKADWPRERLALNLEGSCPLLEVSASDVDSSGTAHRSRLYVFPNQDAAAAAAFRRIQAGLRRHGRKAPPPINMVALPIAAQIAQRFEPNPGSDWFVDNPWR